MAGVYFGNTLANVSGYGAKLVVTFFLSPFVVHSLGDAMYGVWVLLISLTGYMGLLDLGATTSISRYINLSIAKNDQERLNRIVSTSLVLYAILGLVIVGIGATLGPVLYALFSRLPMGMTAQARVILVVLSGNIVMGFAAGVFRQLLAARDRFGVINGVTVTTLIAGAIGTVAALASGWGMLGLASVQLLSSTLACALLFWLARRWGPPFAIAPSNVTKATFQDIVHFGAYAFVADVGVQLIYYTNSLVIGRLIGAAAITFYNIPFMLVDYGLTAIKQVRAVLAPELLKTGARSNPSEMQWLVERTTRFVMIFAVPLMIGIVVFGRDFISKWMGAKYAEHYPILIVLALAQLGALAAWPCSTLLLGIGRVRLLAACVVAEGLTNLTLGIVLVLRFHLGLMGIALGSLVPSLVFSSFLLPILACRSASLSLRRYVRETVLRWLSATALIAVPYLLLPRLSSFSDWPTFFGKGVLFVCLYVPIGIATLTTKGECSQMRTLLGKYSRLAGVRD